MSYLDKDGLEYLWKKVRDADIVGISSKVLAHRGYTTDNNPYCRDNSIFAFVNAGVHGFKGIEVDPRKDVNNVLVCLHNPYVDDLSDSTGNISDLSYLDVKYKTKANNIVTDVHLTTVREMLVIAKIYNFFVLFDMGKNVVTCQEIVAECESADFHNYGFFNVADVNELLTVPDYVIKVLGNDVFIHTESELNEYIAMFGSAKNLGVRVLTSNTTDEQLQLIKNKGFLIFANFDPSNRIGTCTQSYVSMIDFIMGDYTPSAITGPFTVELQHVYGDIKTYADSLVAPCFTVVQAIAPSASLPLNQNFFVYIHKASNNYIKLIAIRAFGGDEAYILTKIRGTWDNNWTDLWSGLWSGFNSFTELINTTETTYNIKLYGYAVGKSVTISALRESNHVASSGWTTIGTIPTAYAPATDLTIYCTDGAGNRLIFRVNVEGKIMIYAIPNQQIACVITYTIR